ncbi:MAG: mismatch repair protein, partial [Acidobacteriaceae bacterium]
MESPRDVYSRLLKENQARIALGKTLDRRLGWAKVAVFAIAAIAAIALLHTPRRLPYVAIPAAVFAVLAVAHENLLRRLREQERVSQFYERGLARLDGAWPGTGEGGERFLDAAHPYARDLDIFGKGSLFELLCTAQTRSGEETLARWLLAAAAPDEVRERHAAVLELQEQVRLRERLFVAGQHVRAGVHPEEVAAWGEGAVALQQAWLPWALSALAVLWAGTAIWWFVTGGWYPLVVVSLVNLGVGRRVRMQGEEIAEATEHAAGDLKVLAEVLAILEQRGFASERLRKLRAALDAGDMAPSRALRKLRRLMEFIESRENMMVRFVAPVIFYTPLVATVAERWKRRFGPKIRGWLAAVGEFEALAALAGYAWEHPRDVLPEFQEEAPLFEAEELKHPLLPESGAVGNDLKLGRELRLLLVSGPNMAGKSTLLRGVGINAVLAQCGAPVRARRLRMSPLAVGASICVLDSLQGGVSRFYAEIRRLKVLSDLASRFDSSQGLASGAAPLLFLLDELLSGTNSHDRLEGTR